MKHGWKCHGSCHRGRRPRKAVGFRWPQIFNPINKEMWVIEVNPPNEEAAFTLNQSAPVSHVKLGRKPISFGIKKQLLQKTVAHGKMFKTVGQDMNFITQNIKIALLLSLTCFSKTNWKKLYFWNIISKMYNML